MSFIEASFANSFSDVWLLTGGVGKNLQVWQQGLVSAILEAGASMGAALEGLKKFCTAWQGVSAESAKALGDTCLQFFQQAGQVVETCIPELVERMSIAMDKQILQTQQFFMDHADLEAFLPELDGVPEQFWKECAHWCANSSNAALCKDGLLKMAEILDLKENTQINQAKDQAVTKCRKHMAQYWCCVCAEAIQGLETEPTVFQLRTCLHILQDGLANALAVAAEGFPGDGELKAWATRWVLSEIFGKKLVSCLLGPENQ